MVRGQNQLKRMQRTPFGWGQDDFRRLYRAHGFEIIEGTRYLVVRHPDHRGLSTTVARQQELPPVYVHTAVQLIAEMRRRMAKRGAQERGKR